MTVYAPAFNEDVAAVVERAGATGPTYIRLGRGELPAGVMAPAYHPWRCLIDGKGPVVIVAGPLAGVAMAALTDLKQVDPTVWVISELPMAVARPPELLIAQITATGRLCVIEEHVGHGGLGAMMASWILQNGIALRNFRHLYAQGYPSGLYGSQAFSSPRRAGLTRIRSAPRLWIWRNDSDRHAEGTRRSCRDIERPHPDTRRRRLRRRQSGASLAARPQRRNGRRSPAAGLALGPAGSAAPAGGGHHQRGRAEADGRGDPAAYDLQLRSLWSLCFRERSRFDLSHQFQCIGDADGASAGGRVGRVRKCRQFFGIWHERCRTTRERPDAAQQPLCGFQGRGEPIHHLCRQKLATADRQPAVVFRLWSAGGRIPAHTDASPSRPSGGIPLLSSRRTRRAISSMSRMPARLSLPRPPG